MAILYELPAAVLWQGEHWSLLKPEWLAGNLKPLPWQDVQKPAIEETLWDLMSGAVLPELAVVVAAAGITIVFVCVTVVGL